MREWWSLSDILQMGHRSLPGSDRGLRDFIEGSGWNQDKNRFRDVPGSGGKGGVRREYHRTLLPRVMQVDLQHQDILAEIAEQEREDDIEAKAEELQLRYEMAPGKTKAKAQERMKAVMLIDELISTMNVGEAINVAVKRTGFSKRTLARMRSEISGHPRVLWLAVLTPEYGKGRPQKRVNDEALNFIISDYRRAGETSFAACYDRLLDIAMERGWGKMPSPKTMLRRVKDSMGAAAFVMSRQGVDAAMRMIPSLERDKSMLHAMEEVNADGHVADVMVEFPDGYVGRPIVVGFQDVYSNVLLSFRIDKTENKELIRLAAADMITTFGVPEIASFDNGRAFMSKMLVGRMKHRFRGKITDRDPRGIFPQIGTKVQAVLPYHGQSKPIERVWRNVCDRVAKHAEFDGAYTGNSPQNKPHNYGGKPVPLADFERILTLEIDRYNKKGGRNTRTARGRSYAETFRESYARGLITKATSYQHRLFLLEAEQKTARKQDGAIYLGENRYWCEELTDYAGRKVNVRFDPQNLHDDVFIYSADDSKFIARAKCLHAVGFRDAQGAREIAKMRKTYRKKWREAAIAAGNLSAAEVAAIHASMTSSELEFADFANRQQIQKVVGLDFEGASEAKAVIEGEADTSFGTGLTASLGVSNIFDTPGTKKEDG